MQLDAIRSHEDSMEILLQKSSLELLLRLLEMQSRWLAGMKILDITKNSKASSTQSSSTDLKTPTLESLRVSMLKHKVYHSIIHQY